MLSSCCWRSEAIPSQIFTKVQTFFENSARHRQKISFCHYFLSRGPISWRVGGDGKTMRLRRYTGLAGDRVAGGDYILFLFCHPGGFGACGATYCLWLLMGYGKQCACGATRGWRGDRVAGGDYIFFLFCHPGGFGAYGATYCLWLLMGKQCACGATQGRREANGAHKGRLHIFCFAIRVALAPTQSSKMTPSSLTPPRRLVGACSRRRRPCLPPTACSAAGALFPKNRTTNQNTHPIPQTITTFTPKKPQKAKQAICQSTSTPSASG